MTATPNPPNAGATGDMPSAADAQERLERAARSQHTTPAATPAVLISYAILCTVGTFTTLGLYLVEQVPPIDGFAPKTALLTMAAAWIIVAILAALLFRERWRRGLAARWVGYLAIWTVLWVAGMVLSASTAGLVIGMLFILPFVFAIATEARQAKLAAEAGR